MKENKITAGIKSIRFGGYLRLLTRAGPTTLDYLLLLGGVVFAIAAGVPFPLLGILFGQLVDDLNSSSCSDSQAGSNGQVSSAVTQKVLYVVYVTIANFCFIYIHTGCWSWFGERLVRRLRDEYFQSLLRQELAFFDERPAGDVSSRLTTDLDTIQAGTSEKVGIVIATVSYFVASYIVSFIKDSKLAGILVSLVPAYFLMTFIGTHFIKKYSGAVSTSIASATSIASESLSRISLVHAFNANSRLEANFLKHLSDAQKAGYKKAVTAATQLALLYFIAYSTNAVAYWQGSRTIAADVDENGTSSSVGAVYTVIFLLVDASFILSQVAPFLQIFGSAVASSESLHETINRPSKIDGTNPDGGQSISSVNGDIQIRDVDFTYVSRPGVQVLKKLSLNIPANKHTAIVGQSGSGKSTLAALITRLYDPDSGTITLDGIDLKHLNVSSLRGSIGTVQQDPSLFDRSVLENIAYGLLCAADRDSPINKALLDSSLPDLVKAVQDGSDWDTAIKASTPVVTEIVRKVRDAAAAADVLRFVDGLQHGLATSVGHVGGRLSGGQKQRIAVARAVVRNPRILLLDEATSSLDSRSEQSILKALENVSQGRTTIAIAHRISTIKKADNIVVMKHGELIEQGSHAELMAYNGIYASMVRLQEVGSGDVDTTSARTSMTTLRADEVNVKSDEEAKFVDSKEAVPDTLEASSQEEAPLDEKVAETSNKKQKKDKKKKEKTILPLGATLRGVGRLVRPHLLWAFIGFTGSIIVGGSYSGEAVIFGHTISALSPCQDGNTIRSRGSFFALLFFVLAVVEFFANLVSGSLFGMVSEQVLLKARQASFHTVLRKDITWHTTNDRNSATLLAYITTDTNAVAALTGTTLGVLFAVTINFVAGIILSNIIAWRISLVLMACIPVLLGSGIMRIRVLAQFQERHQKAFAQATSITVEAVNSIRTISLYSLEKVTHGVYRRSLSEPYKATVKSIAYSNVWLSTAYSVSNLVYALGYWWGTKNIVEGRYSQTQFFIVLPALLFSAQSCGQLFALAPDFARSRVGAARILDLIGLGNKKINGPLDPAVDPHCYSHSKNSGDTEKTPGASSSDHTPSTQSGVGIKIQDAVFAYPNRPDSIILKGLCLDIKPGQFCALVGPSGAGKSTIISLIERFYDPSSGTVEVDGRNLALQHGTDFRNDIAIVPQESVLFEGSVRFNLSIGASPGHEASDEEIEAACRLANIHDTIAALPDGYDTRCGPNGTAFSGGQKQRLSIARALVRKPRLLLLDEGTSALDAESEKLVQDALERAARGITVVAIAHRLRTIERADRIFVIEEGVCTASGTHRELLESSETYKVNALHQTLDRKEDADDTPAQGPSST
ncbi:ABC multidrug transporter SitT [Pseudovirgaria hyperparasitica]|uniref:ABC multidrug transporter SitT n=1 Tax=Pseudovirgaria hyperparasitica TaxID=470096 RepID=A0A6A6VTI7_9PEZI|nr:ABC multidrug transporter SitT [Pseudovirgaria hyperparasitica]KAF2753106.1 ABC multidrug transporter SitT [Pseudovirgaria hyperparasitica]